MTTIEETLNQQYAMVRDARQVLLGYCTGISTADFIRSSPSVGNGGSIRSLLTHVANTYFGWLSHMALHRPFDKIGLEALPELKDCMAYYEKVDSLVQEFLGHFRDHLTDPFTGVALGQPLTTTPIMLFTHVVTHEFHHKGQMLTLSRMWGYLPVDTDVLRT